MQLSQCPSCCPSLLVGAVLALDESDVVPLEHDPAQRLAGVPLGVHLRGLVQHEVHVLIKTDNLPLNPRVDILVEPDNHASSVLKIPTENECFLNLLVRMKTFTLPKNQVDWLHHHLLHFLSSSVRHSVLFLTKSEMKWATLSLFLGFC